MEPVKHTLKILSILLFVSAPALALDIGFNFRTTRAFVTDSANYNFISDTMTTPATTNGITYNWVSGNDPDTLGGGSRDRNSGIDVRLAGMNFCGNQISSAIFHMCGFTAGAYTFQMGYGDAGGNQQNNYLSLQNSDGTLLVGPLHVTTLATPTFGDAAGATYSAAAWPGSEATVNGTITTSCINLWMGSGLTTDGTNSTIDTLFIHQVPASAAVNPTLSFTRGTGTMQITPGSGKLTVH